MFRKPLILAAGIAVAAASSLAAAQSTDALVDKYTSLAGSRQKAEQLVTGLSKGGDFKVGTMNVDNDNGKLGNGEINIALSLVQADITKNELGLDAALEDVLGQRASGEGWGRIAQSMGVKLGELVRSEKAQPPERVARSDKHMAKPERLERPDRAEKPQRPERPERPERAAR